MLKFFSTRTELPPFERALFRLFLAGGLLSGLVVALWMAGALLHDALASLGVYPVTMLTRALFFLYDGIASFFALPAALMASIALLFMVGTHLNYWKRATREEIMTREFAVRPISGALLHMGTALGVLVMYFGARDLSRLALGVDAPIYASAPGSVMALIVLGMIPMTMIQAVMVHKTDLLDWEVGANDDFGWRAVIMTGALQLIGFVMASEAVADAAAARAPHVLVGIGCMVGIVLCAAGCAVFRLPRLFPEFDKPDQSQGTEVQAEKNEAPVEDLR